MRDLGTWSGPCHETGEGKTQYFSSNTCKVEIGGNGDVSQDTARAVRVPARPRRCGVSTWEKGHGFMWEEKETKVHTWIKTT